MTGRAGPCERRGLAMVDSLVEDLRRASRDAAGPGDARDARAAQVYRGSHRPRAMNARVPGCGALPCPDLVSDTARFSDDFNSVDLRVSRPFSLGGSRIEPMVEVFNLLNTENILGTTNTNYSGFANVLVRDSEDPASPGYLTSSRFGTPVTPAGGVFGSGGPRAMQLAVRVTF